MKNGTRTNRNQQAADENEAWKEISQTTSYKPVMNKSWKNLQKLAKKIRPGSMQNFAKHPRRSPKMHFFSSNQWKKLKNCRKQYKPNTELHQDAKLKKNRIESINLQRCKNEFPFNLKSFLAAWKLA